MLDSVHEASTTCKAGLDCSVSKIHSSLQEEKVQKLTEECSLIWQRRVLVSFTASRMKLGLLDHHSALVYNRYPVMQAACHHVFIAHQNLELHCFVITFCNNRDPSTILNKEYIFNWFTAAGTRREPWTPRFLLRKLIKISPHYTSVKYNDCSNRNKIPLKTGKKCQIPTNQWGSSS